MTDPFLSVSPCSHSQPRRDRRPQCLAEHHYVIEKGEMIWSGGNRTLSANAGMRSRFLGI
jgi:hypothetical protein